MAILETLNTVFKVTTSLNTAGGTPLLRVYNNASATNTRAVSSRFVITAATADYTVDTGNLASFDSLILIFSESVDEIYLSTVLADESIGEDIQAIAIDGLVSETVIHIDASGSGADVVCDMMLISNEAVV